MSAVHLIFVGLLIICSYHGASTQKNRSPCLRNEFKCKEDGKCIPISWRCDADLKGILACSDGSHKSNCSEHQCLNGDHRCGNGYCIPQAWVCDGRPHCFDRSDEKGCFPVTDVVCLRNQFRCTNGKCIPILNRCNGNTDCSDKSDEHGLYCPNWCPEGYVRCNSTIHDETRICIPKSRLCNREFDCPDDSDEKDCDKCEKWGCSQGCKDTPKGPECFCNEGYRLNLKNKRTCLVKANPLQCLGNQFTCADGKECIPIHYRCDSSVSTQLGCSDGSHLANCDKHQCLEGEFRCGSGQCVPASWVCDVGLNCADKSDEHDCDHTQHFTDTVCLRNQFRCKTGKCIPIYKRCDGFGQAGGDCPDHTDELECPENWCPEGYGRCDKPMNDGSKNCIQKSHFCNGETDCDDDSDEKDCDKCENWGCSQYCRETSPWPQCYCEEGYKLDAKDKRTCRIIGE